RTTMRVRGVAKLTDVIGSSGAPPFKSDWHKEDYPGAAAVSAFDPERHPHAWAGTANGTGCYAVKPEGNSHASASGDDPKGTERISSGEEHDLPMVRQGRRGCCPLLRRDVSRQRGGCYPPCCPVTTRPARRATY